MTLLLASWLVTQTWAWSPVPTATKYRIYYGSLPMTWCAPQYVEFSSSICDATECQGDTGEPMGPAIYFNVVAVNAAGVESVWDHGVKVPCP